MKNVATETDTFSSLCRTWFRNGSTLHRTTTIGPSAYMKWGSSWLLPMVPASFSLKHVSGMCVFDMCHIQCLPLLHMFPLHVWLFTVLKCNRKALTRASPEAQHTGQHNFLLLFLKIMRETNLFFLTHFSLECLTIETPNRLKHLVLGGL